MATFKRETPLGPLQRANPVMRSRRLMLPAYVGLHAAMLEQMFPSANHSLKTWGRTPDVKDNDPHWIGVRKQTPLHTDKGYPAITHQIMVNVDDGFALRGVDGHLLRLYRGLYFVLDTHSPHQLAAIAEKPQWYLALSYDTETDDMLDNDVIYALLTYAQTFQFNPRDLPK